MCDGWTNWDTKAVGLWLSNNEYEYNLWSQVASRESIDYLADRIENHVRTNQAPRGLYADKPDLDEVNWHEVAEAFIED